MLHRLGILGGLGQIGGGERDENLFQILARFNHAPEMRGCQLHAPWIGERMADFTAQNEKIGMPQRQHAFLPLFPVRPDDELHVYRVGVADGNTGLQPAKLHLPDPAKGIGAGFKSARIFGHRLSD